MTPDLRRELLSLLSALCDGEIDAAGRERLRALLAADAECRRVYLEYVDTHARLLTPPLPGTAVTPAAPRRGRWAQVARYAAVSAATLAASVLVQFVWPGQHTKGTSPPA